MTILATGAVLLGQSTGWTAELALTPAEVIPGGIVRVMVRGACEEAEGQINDKPLRFFHVSADGPLVALMGIDLDVPPGAQSVAVRCQGRVMNATLRIRAHAFPRQELTVASRYVQPNPADQARAAKEAKRLKQLWATASSERLWHGRFQRPAPGPLGAAFGLRRVFNNKPRSPHSGIDIRAPHGTLVAAANRGRVVLRSDLFFSGNTVVLDHGLGLYTLYLHLSAFRVDEGDLVAKGQVVGLVGATGRVTGPHLHFSARLGGARVEPWQLITDDFEGSQAGAARAPNSARDQAGRSERRMTL